MGLHQLQHRMMLWTERSHNQSQAHLLKRRRSLSWPQTHPVVGERGVKVPHLTLQLLNLMELQSQKATKMPMLTRMEMVKRRRPKHHVGLDEA